MPINERAYRMGFGLRQQGECGFMRLLRPQILPESPLQGCAEAAIALVCPFAL